MVPRVPINQKCKKDETPQVFYFTDSHSTTIFSWLKDTETDIELDLGFACQYVPKTVFGLTL